MDYISLSLQMSVLFWCLFVCFYGGHYFEDTLKTPEFVMLFDNINPEMVQPNKPSLGKKQL